MPIESAPIIFPASDLEFGCQCFLSLDWHGLLTADTSMATLDGWSWTEIATISQKSTPFLGVLRSNRSPNHCTVKLEMVGGRRKSIRLRDGSDLKRFFHAVARFTPTEKLGRPLWSVALHAGKRRALRLLHYPNPNLNYSPSAAGVATVVQHQSGRTTLQVSRSTGDLESAEERSSSRESQHWPIEETVNRDTFIVRLPGTPHAPSMHHTLKKKHEEEKEKEEKESVSSEAKSQYEDVESLNSLKAISVSEAETQTDNISEPEFSSPLLLPPIPPPPPPLSLFQTPTYRPLKKGVIFSPSSKEVAPLQANLLDELKSNFRSGIFIPPVRPKLPPAIALAAKKATLKKVSSSSSALLPSSSFSFSSPDSPSSAKSTSTSPSSQESAPANDEDGEDSEEEEKEEIDTGGGRMTLFEELKSFIRFGRLRHVTPPPRNNHTFTKDFRFTFQLRHRMQSAPALLPVTPYFPAPKRVGMPSQEEEENGNFEENSIHQNGGFSIQENPSQQQLNSFILLPPPTPPPPPPPQVIQCHPFPENQDEQKDASEVDPDSNNNSNAQFLACQLTPVPCREHGTDLVVQQDPLITRSVTPEKTPYGLITDQACRRLSFDTVCENEGEDDEKNEENGEHFISSSKSDISSSEISSSLS